jgi:uncharacterized PurR-regulated membrane protein YhhQ (DUF165 family)
MMNEILFIAHFLFVFFVTVVALCNGPFVLQSLLALYVVLAHLCVLKKMMFFGVVVTGCDVYLMAGICGLLMGRELWGARFVYDVSVISGAISFMFLVLCWFQVAYHAVPGDPFTTAFMTTIGLMSWVAMYNLIAHYVAQFVTLVVANKLSRWQKQIVSPGAAIITLICGQSIHSLLFLGGLFNTHHSLQQLGNMVGVSLLFKIILILGSSFFCSIAGWCRRYGYAV